MPLSTATVTFDISDQLGVDYDVRRGIRGWVDTNIPTDTVVDTDGNKVRLGSGKVTFNDDGTGSFTVWTPGTGSNPASWQTYFHVEYVDSGNHAKGRTTRTFGPFTITGNADLADLVDEMEIPPDFSGSGFLAQAQAYLDAQEDLSGIATPDALVAALVPLPSGSATTAALANTYGRGKSADAYATTRAAFTAADASDGLLWLATGAHATGGGASIVPTKALSITGEHAAASILNLNATTGPGINYVGSFGGSAFDGSIIERLHIWGTVTGGAALIRQYGVGLQRLRNLIIQNSSSPAFHFDSCQDFALEDIDALSAGGTGGTKTDAVAYFTDCNNVYLDKMRIEAPKGHGLYFEDTNTVTLDGGKIDGNADTPSTLAFLVADNSDVILSNWKTSGAKASPVKVAGYGQVKFTNGASMGYITADAIVDATTTAYRRRNISDGWLPGVIDFPAVIIDDLSLAAQGANNPAHVVKSLIKAVAPSPVYAPAGRTGNIKVTYAAFTDGDTGLLKLLYDYETTPATWVTPAANDMHTGLWLVNKTSGKRARVYADYSGGGGIYLDPAPGATAADFALGENYRMEYREKPGVEIRLGQVRVATRQGRGQLTSLDRFYPCKQAAKVTTTAASYSGTTYQTTVTTSGLTSGALVGAFLTNGTTSWLIRANTTTTITLDHDVAAAIPNGAYRVEWGEVWSGSVTYV